MLRAPLPSILVKTAPEPQAVKSRAVTLALRGSAKSRNELKSRWNRVLCTLDGVIAVMGFFILKINLQEIKK